MPMYRSPRAEPTGRPWVGVRKRLKKEAERENGYKRRMSWFGGVLCFTDTKEPVPGVENVPKSGKAVVGFKGAQPVPAGKVPKTVTTQELTLDPMPWDRSSRGRSGTSRRPRSTGAVVLSEDEFRATIQGVPDEGLYRF